MSGWMDYIKKALKLGLPARKLAIKFNVPTTRRGAPKPNLISIIALDRIEDQKDSVNFLRALQKQARQLNGCTLSVKSRMALTGALLGLYYPVALKMLTKYSKDGGVPDSEIRQEALDLVIDLVARSIDSYKIVFKKLYQASSVSLALSHGTFMQSAFRILELTKFKQKAKGLRYQPLSDAAWLAANNTYLAMLALNKCDESMPTLETTSGKKASQTLTDLYLALQIAAKLDILKWPTEWQSFVDSYSNASDRTVRIKPDTGDAPTRNLTLSYAYDQRPTRLARAADDAELGPSAIIDWEGLNRVVAKDMQMFTLGQSQYEKVNISKKFDTLTYTEAMAIVKLQMELFRGEARPPPADAEGGQAVDMRLYIGFWSVYDLLDNNFHPLHNESVGTRLEDSLAKRSAHLAADDVATHASLWTVQSRGEQEATLRTQETQFTTNMRIGSLIAFGVGNEGIKNPGIGVISRIFRPSSKAVVVDIEKFGNRAEPVLITPDLSNGGKVNPKEKQTLGAILVRYTDSKASLLIPPDTGLGERTKLLMKRDKQVFTVSLGKIDGVTKDFSLFPLVRA